MSRAEIIRMAVEAGYGYAMADLHGPALERFAAIIAAAEREACAKVCEMRVERPGDYGGRFGGYGNFMGEQTGPECAAAIRNRSSK